MIPVLYPSTETSFTNNGLGGLPDAISCVVTEQRNTQGGYWLEMDYPIDGLHYADIAPERIIYAAPSMGNTPQPFRISRITRPINGIVHIEAPHISAQLQKITTSGTYTARSFTGITYDYAQAARGLGQTFPFWFSSDKTFTETQISFPEPTPFANVLLGAEGSILDTYGGEYEWNGKEVILHDSRGVDSGLEIRYGVNMSDLEAETDATELVTACVPFWKGTVNEQDVVVMGDMCSADNASAYAYVRCVPLDVSQQFELEQDEQPTAAQVTAKGQAFINSTSRKLLQTSIRVSYEPTTSGIGERRINLCDTVRVVYPDLNVSSISKVVETKFNTLTERYDELTIGTIRNNIVDTIAGLISGGAISYSGGSGSGGGGGSAVGAVLYNMPQSLNEAQKAQARQNIGVGSGGGSGSNYYVLAEDIGISILNSGTDNSAALNSFIASNSESRTIRFGCGSYPFADTINMTTTTGMVGNGRETKLVYSGTGTFLNFTVYTAPHIYDLIIKGSGSGIGLKLGLKRSGSDDIVSCRGVLMNVHFYDWTDAINIGGAWGWQIVNMNGYNISGWLIHVTGIWNTSTIIGGEYENGANGGVFWDANSNSNAVNFIGIVWESLQSHVFKVGSSAGAVSVNIEGCYFENKKDYSGNSSVARLIDSDKSNSVFNFIGENSIAWNQTIRSVGIVKNPPAASLLALGYYRQPYVVPSARLSAIQKPDYNFHHGEIFDIENAVLNTDPDRFNGSDVAMKIDDRGLNVAAIASGGGYIHTTFDASQAIQRLYMRLPEGLYDLRNINVGFEFLVPSGTDFSEIVSIYCRIVNVTSNTSQDNGLAVARYISMFGSDVTGTYDRYQVMNCYRNATVGNPSVTIGDEHFYNLDMFVSGADVIFTKIFIDDGKGEFVSQNLFDETIETVQADIEEIKELTSPYVDLDYIESDGASYIDTGIAPNANIKITARFKLTSTDIVNDAARQYVFGTYSIVDGTVESRAQFYYGGSDTDAASREFIGWGSGANNVGYKYLNIVPDADTHTASLNGAFTLDGTQHIVLSNSVFTAPKSIYLFACNEDGVAAHFSDGMRIEAVSIYDDSMLIARFVPKMRRADGAVGMYDEIGETFYENKGFGSFRNETITPQEQEAFPVTLNADGTVNTFDSALTYNAASASVLNGTSKKLIVTWGNSIFIAEANEKLSGANGDVKFITDCEHDGIQRHIIFTLTSSNALQTTLIETYARVPVTVWEVTDVTQGLLARNTNISSNLEWHLTALNLAPFKRIKIYAKAGRKTGAAAQDSSIVPAVIIEMLLDDRAKETVSQNVFIGSAVVQNPNDANRLGTLTCAVSADKTKFAVTRATSLYGTAATSNTDCYQYVFKIEGYYD